MLAFINIAILCAVTLAIIQFTDNNFDTTLKFDFSFQVVLVVLVLQALLLLLSACAWSVLLKNTTNAKLPVYGGVEQVGFMLVGKYLPGKVWGVAIRALTSNKYNIPARKVIEASFIEQILTLYIASVMGLAVYFWYWSPALSLISLFLLILFGHIIFNVGLDILFRISYRIRKYLKLVDAKQSMRSISFLDFIKLVALYGSLWVIIAIILYVLTDSFGLDLTTESFIAFFGAYMVAVAVGFLALIAPGGIGVRESVFVAMTSIIIDINVAIQLALIFRVWNSLYDIFAATIGYFVYLMYPSRDDVKK